MTNDIITIDNSIAEIQSSQKLCKMLMQSTHYQKIGAQGIFAIVETAKSIGIDPLQALNGGMYFVKGKVELSSAMMNAIIRSKGHSITKDKRSNNEICILHGKRADNQDTWVESFSIDDAKQAGIYANQWIKYPKDMLFARALSRLARQLFPDLIKGCYVQGEIAMDTAIPEQDTATLLGPEGAESLAGELISHPEYKDQVQAYLDRQGLSMEELPLEHAEKMFRRIEELREEASE